MINHTQPSVILSEVAVSRSEAARQSKDPMPACISNRPVKEFSARIIAALLTLILAASFASAQTLTGTVKNATTGKPSAGDDVILLNLSQGMEEAGRTKSDAKGNFSFKLDNEQGPHLIRAVHDGVTYHRMAPPGTTSVEVEVYDAGKKINGINVVADIMRVQAQQGEMEVLRAFAVENDSKPPRTQMNERNLEFYLPEGAKILQAEATTANGNPLKTNPVPVDDKKTRYAFLFPLRPGVTQFEVEYSVPYTGSANIDPKSVYPLQHFVAILPKAMQFEAASGAGYKPMNDPQQPDANVQVASGTKLGQTLAFKISGEGLLQSRQEDAGQPGEGQSSAQNDNRPGGGLGPPIDAPDPLQQRKLLGISYNWWVLGGLALALIVGGVFIAQRQQVAQRTNRPVGRSRGAEIEDEDFAPVEVAAVQHGDASNGRAPQAARSTTSMLLQGLKEELFQLEVEHKQGRITQQEYEKTKAALDQTLEHALKREAQKT
jgi:hypothetical protein